MHLSRFMQNVFNLQSEKLYYCKGVYTLTRPSTSFPSVFRHCNSTHDHSIISLDLYYPSRPIRCHSTSTRLL